MPIPEQFNDNLYNWINKVPGDIGAMNSELFTFQKYWSSFTPDQKAAIITLIRGMITTAKNDLTEIDAYIQTIPTS